MSKLPMYNASTSNGLIDKLSSGAKNMAYSAAAGLLSLPLITGTVPQTGYSTIDNTVRSGPAVAGEKKIASLDKITFPDYRRAKERTSDVLKEIGFRVKSPTEYLTISRSEPKVIAFIYDDSKPASNFALAKIFQHLLEEEPYNKIKFVAVDASRLTNKEIKNIKTDVTPSIIYHAEGKTYGPAKGGPADRTEYKKQLEANRKWLKWISNTQKVSSLTK